MYLASFVAAEILLHRDQKQQGMVLKVDVFLDLVYDFLYTRVSVSDA